MHAPQYQRQSHYRTVHLHLSSPGSCHADNPEHFGRMQDIEGTSGEGLDDESQVVSLNGSAGSLTIEGELKDPLQHSRTRDLATSSVRPESAVGVANDVSEDRQCSIRWNFDQERAQGFITGFHGVGGCPHSSTFFIT